MGNFKKNNELYGLYDIGDLILNQSKVQVLKITFYDGIPVILFKRFVKKIVLGTTNTYISSGSINYSDVNFDEVEAEESPTPYDKTTLKMVVNLSGQPLPLDITRTEVGVNSFLYKTTLETPFNVFVLGGASSPQEFLMLVEYA